MIQSVIDVALQNVKAFGGGDVPVPLLLDLSEDPWLNEGTPVVTVCKLLTNASKCRAGTLIW